MVLHIDDKKGGDFSSLLLHEVNSEDGGLSLLVLETPANGLYPSPPALLNITSVQADWMTKLDVAAHINKFIGVVNTTTLDLSNDGDVYKPRGPG